MKTLEIEGTLEIDQDRGVIYFHTKEGITLMRMCSLPTPIPDPTEGEPRLLDVTHMFGSSWKGIVKTKFGGG